MMYCVEGKQEPVVMAVLDAVKAFDQNFWNIG